MASRTGGQAGGRQGREVHVFFLQPEYEYRNAQNTCTCTRSTLSAHHYKYKLQFLYGITAKTGAIKVRLDKSLKPHRPRQSHKSAVRKLAKTQRENHSVLRNLPFRPKPSPPPQGGQQNSSRTGYLRSRRGGASCHWRAEWAAWDLWGATRLNWRCRRLGRIWCGEILERNLSIFLENF